MLSLVYMALHLHNIQAFLGDLGILYFLSCAGNVKSCSSWEVQCVYASPKWRFLNMTYGCDASSMTTSSILASAWLSCSAASSPPAVACLLLYRSFPNAWKVERLLSFCSEAMSATSFISSSPLSFLLFCLAYKARRISFLSTAHSLQASSIICHYMAKAVLQTALPTAIPRSREILESPFPLGYSLAEGHSCVCTLALDSKAA